MSRGNNAIITKLKTRFIILAMASLTVLLALIVAGMNIINYEKVVSDADERLEVLAENTGRFGDFPDSGNPAGLPGPFGNDDFSDGFSNDFGDNDFGDIEEFFGKGGRGGPSMTRDEAEESRFFAVTVDENSEVKQTFVERISAVDSDEAAEYAQKAVSSGKEKGFVNEFRYSVSEKADDGSVRITFLDCGRVLDSYRDFLKASILMSLIGLVTVFAVICYFAGLIVRPAAESYEKQKRFITDAGHEIKTPLAIIKANIDLMNMELDSVSDRPGNTVSEELDEIRDSLGDINDQVSRLTGLTNDLVYLSRMEEGSNSLVMSEVPLSDIVADSASAFEPLAAEQGKVIVTDIAPMITVKGSTKELEKLMSILLENAVKYSAAKDVQTDGKRNAGEPDQPGSMLPADKLSEEMTQSDMLSDNVTQINVPRIDVFLRKDGRSAVIEVSNNTENELTNEALSHVFERFYRTDSSRNSQTGGHGIGLSMAQAIVAAHGGRISARTTDGRDFIITAVFSLV